MKPRKTSLTIYLGPKDYCDDLSQQWCSFPIRVSFFIKASISETYLVVAQHFHFADKIVILGNHRIEEQGTWEDIKLKAASIEKFALNSQGNNSVSLSANFDRLSAQVRAKDEAEVDLSRQTGDLTLYSMIMAKYKGARLTRT